MRLLFITDFTEQFPYRLLRGIVRYSQDAGEHWVVCKMPTSYKSSVGLREVVSLAESWYIDVVIGQFTPDEDLSVFRKKGMVVLAQDYISRFAGVPNITANYHRMGAMAAERFVSKGFRHFAYFGNNGMCWSDERLKGFRDYLAEAGLADSLYIYDQQRVNDLWFYNRSQLFEWLESLPRPVAIMACDDNQACILVEACSSIGMKVPFDAAIIGVDNDEILCNMTIPSISSIDVDIERGGYEAAEMAHRMVLDPAWPGHDIVLEPLRIVPRASSNVMATKDAAIHGALQYINANIDHKIQVADVLEHVPLSRRLLEQRFLKETGMTVYQYITKMRIDRFEQLLLTSKDSIADIAARMDEPDTKNLSRRFQAVRGCTPSEFRRRNNWKR